MTHIDEIREEIEQVEEWRKNSAIDEATYTARLSKLHRELADAIDRNGSNATEESIGSNNHHMPVNSAMAQSSSGERNAPPEEVAGGGQKPNSNEVKAHQIATGIVSICLLAGMWWLLSPFITAGFQAADKLANPKTFVVSIAGVRQHQTNCELIVEFRNPGDDLISWAYIRTNAVDRDGKVLGQTSASTSNLRGNGIGVGALRFHNVGCHEIHRLRGMDVTVGTQVEIASDSAVPMEI